MPHEDYIKYNTICNEWRMMSGIMILDHEFGYILKECHIQSYSSKFPCDISFHKVAVDYTKLFKIIKRYKD